MGAQLGNLEWAYLPGTFEIWLKGGLEVKCLTLCGSSVKGTWREGSLAGDPEGYVEKAVEKGISFHRAPFGEPGGGLIYWGLCEMDEGGSVDEASLSEEAPWRGGELLHWGPWKICYESLWIQASLSMGAPFHARGTWYVGGAHVSGNLIDE